MKSGNSAVISLLVLAFLTSAMIFTSGCLKNDDRSDKGQWKDLSGLKEAISDVRVFRLREAVGPSDLDEVSNPAETVYLLIGIQKNITTFDYNSIKDFIKKGGKAIIADDGTMANRLASIPTISGLNELRFVGKPYIVGNTLAEKNSGVDPGYIYNTSFIESTATIKGAKFNLVIHEPMGLMDTDDGNAIINTLKQLTVIDENGNGEMDLEDTYRPYGPIGVEYRIGDNGGGILYVSTTGMFTDNVFTLRDNGEWLKNYLFNWLPQGGDVILDQSKQNYNYSPHLVKIPE